VTRVSAEQATALLREGEIELLGLLPNASNYTFAVRMLHRELQTLAVYKPREGEMPLWDFPEGTLYAREMAAFEVSRALGWDFVPPTVIRDGPHGIGMVQLFIDADPEQHYLTLMPEHAEVFRRVAAFDVLTNNADRKAGHCLLEQGTGRIWTVDHGVCFSADPKLRTVIWDFAGEQLATDVLGAARRFRTTLEPGCDVLRRIEQLLAPDEVEALRARADDLLATGLFPDVPLDRRPYPWPPV